MNSLNFSNMSYTNKDFNSIYTELLEIAKTLSYKWDPTISVEGDPGVLLIKLMALLGDKLNYNIDKNILEQFPSSVTQYGNAYQMLNLCGYAMKYYRSARGKVNLSLSKPLELSDDEKATLTVSNDNDLLHYVLPRFTTVSNSSNDIVYTLVDTVTLPSNGDTVSCIALEGKPQTYSVNGDTLITPQYLDSFNRLYFSESDVAQNGIYISHAGLNNYSDWYPTDNLYIENIGSLCYKFGVLPNTNTCYIQFPSDINNLIGEGLNITYIRGNGRQGNISAKRLSTLFTDTTVTIYRPSVGNYQNSSITSTINSENIYITNESATSGGADPETIDEALVNYEHVKNTFHTLISNLDYENHLYNEQLLGSSLCVDRNNDITNSYNIINTNNMLDTIRKPPKTAVPSSEYFTIDDTALDCFDLRLYGVQFNPITDNPIAYDNCYVVLDKSNTLWWRQVENSITNVCCIQHNFKAFDFDKPFLFKNKYPLNIKVITYNPTSKTDKESIKSAIKVAIYNKFNPRNYGFGKIPSYDELYTTIEKAHSAIKAIILEEYTYQTYAVYKNIYGNIVELQIDTNSEEYVVQKVPVTINHDGIFLKNLYHIPTITTDEITGKKRYDDVQIFKDVDLKYEITDEVHWVEPLDTFVDTTYLCEKVSNDNNIFSGLSYVYIKYKTPLYNEFRTDIVAKSILAGITPYYIGTGEVTESITQNLKPPTQVTTITSRCELYPLDEAQIPYEYTVTENERLVISRPSCIDKDSYGNLISYICKLSDNDMGYLESNCDYLMCEGDYIIFFYRQEEGGNYTYELYRGRGNDLKTENGNLIDRYVVCPNFRLQFGSNVDNITTNALNETADYNALADLKSWVERLISNTKSDRYFVKGLTDNNTTQLIADNIFSHSESKLSGTNSITIKTPNTISINNNTNGTRNCYWILNKVDSDNKCTLFEAGAERYTLQEGEYFIYTNRTQTSLLLLGSGTVIQRSASSDPLLTKWSVDHIAYDLLYEQGLDYLNNKWYNLPDQNSVEVIASQQEILELTKGCSLYLTPLYSTTVYKPIIKKETKETTGGITTVTQTPESDLFYYNGLQFNDTTTLSLVNEDFSNTTLCVYEDNFDKYLTLPTYEPDNPTTYLSIKLPSRAHDYVIDIEYLRLDEATDKTVPLTFGYMNGEVFESQTFNNNYADTTTQDNISIFIIGDDSSSLSRDGVDLGPIAYDPNITEFRLSRSNDNYKVLIKNIHIRHYDSDTKFVQDSLYGITKQTDYSGDALTLNSNDSSLHNYSVYYNDIDGKTTQLVNPTQEILSYNICTRLDINCGPDKPQKLLNTDTNKDFISVISANSNVDLTNKIILCNKDIYYKGLEASTEIKLQDIDDEYDVVNLYEYSDNTDTLVGNDTTYVSVNNFETHINYSSKTTNSNSYYVDFDTPYLTIKKGNYILPIQLNNDLITQSDLTLKVTLVDSKDNTYYLTSKGIITDPTKSINYIKYNMLYLKLKVESENGLEVKSLILEHNKDYRINLVILPLKPFKYKEFKVKDDSTDYFVNPEELKDRIKLLDNEHRYNPLYEFIEGRTIENPLVASSFNNENHIYNKFTIAQYDTSKDLITDKDKEQRIQVVDR